MAKSKSKNWKKKENSLTTFKTLKISSSRSATNPNPISNYIADAKRMKRYPRTKQHSMHTFHKMGLKATYDNSSSKISHHKFSSSAIPEELQEYTENLPIHQEYSPKGDFPSGLSNSNQGMDSEDSGNIGQSKFLKEYKEVLSLNNLSVRSLLTQEECISVLFSLQFVDLSPDLEVSGLKSNMDILDSFCDRFLSDTSDLITASDLYFLLLVVKGQYGQNQKFELEPSEKLQRLEISELKEIRKEYRSMLLNRIRKKTAFVKQPPNMSKKAGYSTNIPFNRDLQLYRSISPTSNQQNNSSQRGKEVRFSLLSKQKSKNIRQMATGERQVVKDKNQKVELKQWIQEKRQKMKTMPGGFGLGTVSSTKSVKSRGSSIPKSIIRKKHRRNMSKGVFNYNLKEVVERSQENSSSRHTRTLSHLDKKRPSDTITMKSEVNVVNFDFPDDYSDYNEDYDEIIPKERKKSIKSPKNTQQKSSYSLFKPFMGETSTNNISKGTSAISKVRSHRGINSKRKKAKSSRNLKVPITTKQNKSHRKKNSVDINQTVLSILKKASKNIGIRGDQLEDLKAVLVSELQE